LPEGCQGHPRDDVVPVDAPVNMLGIRRPSAVSHSKVLAVRGAPSKTHQKTTK
jgi:hypothetical protein